MARKVPPVRPRDAPAKIPRARGLRDLHDDVRANLLAIRRDMRILSAFALATGERVWIITEADRSATTILIPEEY
jgi:hypothetical protein